MWLLVFSWGLFSDPNKGKAKLQCRQRGHVLGISVGTVDSGNAVWAEGSNPKGDWWFRVKHWKVSLFKMAAAQIFLSSPRCLTGRGDAGLGVFYWCSNALAWSFLAAALFPFLEMGCLLCAHVYRKSATYILISHRLTDHRFSSNLYFCKILNRLSLGDFQRYNKYIFIMWSKPDYTNRKWEAVTLGDMLSRGGCDNFFFGATWLDLYMPGCLVKYMCSRVCDVV